MLGTLSGGLALDCAGASVRNALRICAAGVAAGCVLVLVAFAAARTLLPFALCFGVGEWAMFLMAVSRCGEPLYSVVVPLLGLVRGPWVGQPKGFINSAWALHAAACLGIRGCSHTPTAEFPD